MAETIIMAESVTFGFPKSTTLFDGLNLSVPKGEATVLIGPNGCGKSTLISLLAGVAQPQTGAIRIDGEPLGAIPAKVLARRVGILPQSPQAAEGLLVRDLIALGRIPHRGFLSLWSAEDEAALFAALEAVDLVDFSDRPLVALSGGQRQRAFIAMVLAQQPGVLFLDEPTSYLDISHQLRILNLLTGLKKKQGTTIVTALHDIALAASFADHLVVLSDGKIVAQGKPADVVTQAILAEVFDVHANVRRDGETGQLLIIPIGPVEAALAEKMRTA